MGQERGWLYKAKLCAAEVGFRGRSWLRRTPLHVLVRHAPGVRCQRLLYTDTSARRAMYEHLCDRNAMDVTLNRSSTTYLQRQRRTG